MKQIQEQKTNILFWLGKKTKYPIFLLIKEQPCIKTPQLRPRIIWKTHIIIYRYVKDNKKKNTYRCSTTHINQTHQLTCTDTKII